ncbi:HD domain-containing protein [uncultured Methanofollis sp.]|uniref:HD domain-containing protein n=1 Tax=uncultured Methanofollis sp. TaxID=262500 RepID=UPI0026353049|nr:HD domain-containing protein [uncultured Methanofollis sp.]
MVCRKETFVGDIADGDEVDGIFLLRSVEVKQKKNGSPYILAQVADMTGSITCNVWGVQGCGEEVSTAAERLKVGAVYRIRGFARAYNGAVQVSVNEGIADLAEVPPDEISAEDFVCAPVDEVDLKRGVLAMAGGIADGTLRDLVLEAITGAEGFFVKPAAKSRHHEYRGGLAEHTLETARIAAASCDAARIPMDRDLVVAGALLHDIGKASCFDEAGLAFTARPEYDLLGHVATGVIYLTRFRGRIPEERFNHLLHIVQSHHGPHGEVPCQTPEAWAVHLADLTSATLREAADDQMEAAPGTRKNGWRSGGPVWRF